MSNIELVKALGTRFVQRKDVKAFQSPKGEWHPVKCELCKQSGQTCLHCPMNLQDFDDHFSGKKTLGHYLVNPVDQSCKLFAFDLDWMKPRRDDWLNDSFADREEMITQMRCLSEGIAMRVYNTLGISVAIADSGGKGLHVYCFTGSMPAVTCRDLAIGVLEEFACFEPIRGNNFWHHKDPESGYKDIEIETFPKQTEVSETGMGNLMALPLGIHQVTKRRKYFITSKVGLNQLVEMDSMRALEGDLPWE